MTYKHLHKQFTYPKKKPYLRPWKRSRVRDKRFFYGFTSYNSLSFEIFTIAFKFFNRKVI